MDLKNAFLSALFCLMLFSCQKPQSFIYKDIKNLKLSSLGFQQTALSMDLVYYNPNKFGLDLKNLDCEIYIDKNFLGKCKLDTLMHIAKMSEFSLPARIEVEMKTLLKNSLNLIFSQTVLVEVKGTTRVGKAGMYMTIPFEYQKKHDLRLFTN